MSTTIIARYRVVLLSVEAQLQRCGDNVMIPLHRQPTRFAQLKRRRVKIFGRALSSLPSLMFVIRIKQCNHWKGAFSSPIDAVSSTDWALA